MTLNTREVLLLVVTVCGAIHFAVSDSGFVIESRNEESCTTPDSQRGNCLIISECEHVMNIIKTQGISSPDALQFLRESTCGFEGSNPKVCCPVKDDGDADDGSADDRHIFDGDNNKTQDSSKEMGDDPNEPFQNPLSLLPSKCGEDHGNRIIGGERTELDEFPWMAVLEFAHDKGTITGCGGALITKRYVLTAAHCVRSIPSTWRLRNVRLGEYNMNTDPDCEDEGNGEQTCADPVQMVMIEREIVHEDYMKPEVYRNDIALLRLDRDIETTRYVQPICLPTSGDVSQLYWSAGWGQIERKASSDLKLKVSLPYVDFDQCAQVFATKRIYLGDGQMCAGGRAGKDTCKGDSGGPLMKQVREIGKPNRWIVDGVVSIGHSPCGLQGWPAVYTKVHDYLPWILSKLRP